MSEPPAAVCQHCGAALAGRNSVCPACSLLDSSPTRDYAAAPPRTHETSFSLGEGTQFDGRFSIVAAVGIGGMGEVYRAHDEVLNRIVALKLVRPRGLDDESRRRESERLLDEARTAASLNHPSIVTVHDAVAGPDGGYIVMEFIEGRNLTEVLDEDGPLEWSKAVVLLGQVANGLAFAHRQGVVHRDIKPSNIMVTPDGRAKIMDFGLARPTHLPEDSDRRGILGTPEYMSPEQIGRERPAPGTDLFSLGVVAYLLLTGVHPFGAPDLKETIERILGLREEPVHRRVPEVPVALSALVARCLVKDSRRRLGSAEDLAAELAALEEAEPPAEPPTRLVLGTLLAAALVAGVALMLSGSRLEHAHDRELELGASMARALEAGEIIAPAEANALSIYGQLARELPDATLTGAASPALRIRLVRLARTSLDAGDLPHARGLLRDAVRVEPGHPDVLDMLDMVARMEERARALRDPLGLNDLWREAEAALADDRWEDLRGVLEAIEGLSPEDRTPADLRRRAADRLTRRGDAAQLEDDHARAAMLYADALGWAPTDGLLARKQEHAAARARQQSEGRGTPPSAQRDPEPPSTIAAPTPTPTPTPVAIRWPVLPTDLAGWPALVAFPPSNARMVRIPPGSFVMGSDDGPRDERPATSIWLDAFYIDEHEVTNVEYERWDPTHTRSPLSACDLCPVVGVNWDRAQSYARWAGKRLPTEAEWEKAARGGLIDAPYPWGSQTPRGRANYDLNQAREVGRYTPNGYGLFDIGGNVAEWCQDWYDPGTYRRRAGKESIRNPWGPNTEGRKVVRGGSFALHRLTQEQAAERLRVSQREHARPEQSSDDIGFRLVWLPLETNSIR